MTPSEKKLEITLFLGMCKMLSSQSTQLQNEFKQDKKQQFNRTVCAVDNLISCIEKDISDYNKETLDIIGVAMSDGIQQLRKELVDAMNDSSSANSESADALKTLL